MSSAAIQSSQSVYNPYLQRGTQSLVVTASTPKSPQDRVNISSQAQQAALGAQVQEQNSHVYSFATSQGEKALDIKEYFTSKSAGGPIDLDSVPLLLPSQQNIDALSSHSSAEFSQLLAAYDIPQPPAKISYGSAGQLQLPDDYPYQSELTQALEENPSLATEMRTVAALTSHYVGMRQPHSQHEISIAFSEDGFLQLMADDEPYAVA